MSTTREAAPLPALPQATRHGVVDDVSGILTGTFVVSLGVFLLAASGAVTGGTAGLALLITYATGLPVGPVLFAINVPFFVLALVRRGWDFTLRSIACVALVAAFTTLHPLAVPDLAVHPLWAVFAGNLLVGIGLLVLFRHRSSLGGFTIMALLLQDRFGWRAGYTQLVLDSVVILAALLVVPWWTVALSVLGAVVLNTVLVINHRPGRYTGT